MSHIIRGGSAREEDATKRIRLFQSKNKKQNKTKTHGTERSRVHCIVYVLEGLNSGPEPHRELLLVGLIIEALVTQDNGTVIGTMTNHAA